MPSTDLESLRWAVETLQWAKRQKADAKAAEEMARAAIETALGDNESGSINGHTVVTWKRHTQTRLDQKLLAKNFPDIAEACRVTTEVRRFEIVEPE